MMLLILTVLGMGVPAMFAAERKSYVSQAMQALIEIHNKCQKLQRELAARGDPGVLTLTIDSPGSKPQIKVTINSSLPTSPSVDQLFGRKIDGSSAASFISINADEFISAVDTTDAVTNAAIPASWSYVSQTGFINRTAPIKITFKALPTNPSGTYKVNRVLTLYPQGYSEVP